MKSIRVCSSYGTTLDPFVLAVIVGTILPIVGCVGEKSEETLQPDVKAYLELESAEVDKIPFRQIGVWIVDRQQYDNWAAYDAFFFDGETVTIKRSQSGLIPMQSEDGYFRYTAVWDRAYLCFLGPFGELNQVAEFRAGHFQMEHNDSIRKFVRLKDQSLPKDHPLIKPREVYDINRAQAKG